MYDYLIVGSGLFGAVFAHEAAEKGKAAGIGANRHDRFFRTEEGYGALTAEPLTPSFSKS